MKITAEMISSAAQARACPGALLWLRVQPRTWAELVVAYPVWAVWAMIKIADCPIDLDGLDPYERAWVMVKP